MITENQVRITLEQMAMLVRDAKHDVRIKFISPNEETAEDMIRRFKDAYPELVEKLRDTPPLKLRRQDDDNPRRERAQQRDEG